MAVLAGICFVLFAAAVYWAVLLGSHRHQERYAEAQTWLRVGQMSRAISVQVQTLLSGLDYTLQGMESEYEAGDQTAFERAVRAAIDTYPRGTIIQVGVADANGLVVYSSTRKSGEAPAQVSIRDREHFQAHLGQDRVGLFVGRPVLGRVSNRWSIQLSRALHRDGRFIGVLVLSLSPDYIAQYFQAVFERPEDVILLLRDDGTYLARSHHQEAVLGTSVPEERLAQFTPSLRHGTYEAQTSVDQVDRLYAWSRVEGFPLIVSAGLDRAAVFGPVQDALRRSLVRNGVGTALILLGVLLTAWLAIQRQRIDARRIQSERRFMQLAQEVPGGLFQFRISPAGRRTFPFASPGFFAMHCLAPQQGGADGAGLAERIHPRDLRALSASIEECICTGSPWDHKYRVKCPDGTLHWLHGHAKPQREEDGTLLWHGYIHDVSQDQALQEALRSSEERLRLTFGAVRDGLWQWDCKADRVRWDERCYAMLGYADQAFLLRFEDFLARVHPNERKRVDAQLRAHLDQGQDFRVEMRLRTASGAWLWVESRGEVTQRDEHGRPLRMLGTHTDIQQRVEQSQLVKALLDRGSALVVVASPQRDILYANERAARMFGLPAGKALEPASFRTLHYSEESFMEFGELYSLLKAEGTVRAEWALRVPSGELHWFDMQGSLLDPDDIDGNVIWTLLDTDARHRAEAALALAQRRLEAIIERFPSGILVTEVVDQRIVAANQMLVDTLRLKLPPEALVGQTVAGLAPHLPAPLAAMLSTPVDAGASGLNAPPTPPQRTVLALPEGRYLEVALLPLRDNARPLGECWVLHDVTDRKRRESQLETLASTDALTGIPNRRAFMERMDMELEHLRIGMARSAVLIMLDIDHFKHVNDTYGHAVGDVVLRHLVATVAQELRRDDMVGRLGGEEFAVLLPGADEATGLRRAEALRHAIATHAATVETAGAISFTVSLGVYALRPDDASVEACLERADAALYFSKRNGRNRSTPWSPELPQMAPALP